MLEWIAANWMSVLAALFAFGFVVFVHEGGHFLMARAVGVRVFEFSLGFGPQLWKRKVGETEYSLRAVPLGGFVRLDGEDSQDFDPADQGNFQNKTTMQKLGVIVGGCLSNYICGFLVFVLVGLCAGIGTIVPDPSGGTKIKDVLESRPAAAAGLKEGDSIVSINGKNVGNWKEIIDTIGAEAGQPVTLLVQRGSETLTFHVTPDAIEEKAPDGAVVKKGKIGVVPLQQGTVAFEPAAGLGSIIAAYGDQAWRFSITPYTAVKMIASKQMTLKEAGKESGGPVMIGSMLFTAASHGIWPLLYLWFMVSTLVGAFNLLPIPALDGMRGWFVVIGALRKRPIDQEKEAMVHTVGIIVLFAVVIMFTVQDISHLRAGLSFFH